MSDKVNQKVANTVVTWGALQATFCYTNDETEDARDKAQRLINHLVDSRLPGIEKDNENPERKWRDPKLGLDFYIYSFTADYNNLADTYLVQFLLTDSQKNKDRNRLATDSWPKMIAELNRNLNQTGLKHLEGISGYTLAYQAIISDQVADNRTFSELLNDIKIDELLKVARLPHWSANKKYLAETFVLDKQGKVWLIDTPRLDKPKSDNPLDKGSIYLALSVQSSNNNMLNKVIYRQTGGIFTSDMIAHEGYNEIRQYIKYSQQIAPKIKTLADDTSRKLENLVGKKGLGRQVNTLVNQYGQLSGYQTRLKHIGKQLAKQVQYYDKWILEINGGRVLDYHAKQLRTRLNELEQEVEAIQNILDAIDKATSFTTAIATIQDRQDRSQKRLEIFLTIVGIALMVSQIVDASAAGALLTRFGWAASCADAINPVLIWFGSPPPPCSHDRLLTLAVQFIITIAIISPFLLWLFIRLYTDSKES